MPRHAALVAGLLMLAPVLAAAAAAASSTGGVASRPAIAFLRNSGLYVMNGDGSAQRRLRTPKFANAFAWSPDGRRIALEAGGERNHLFVFDADGSNRRALTPAYHHVSLNPVWSPNGRRIAFTHNDDGWDSVWVVNADGRGLKRLTKARYGNRDPAWSPDGRRLVYTSSQRLFVMNADGSAKRSLTEDSAAKPHENRSDRVWTPAAIFFIGSTALRNERPSGFHLFRIRPDGSGLTDLTPGDEQIHSFELSPDRRTIAFATFRGGLFVMGPDGTELRRLTEDGVSARDPTWSPTNGVIAFTGLRGENEEIYAVRVDASGLRNLTRNRASDNSAGWRPALR